MLNVSKNDVRRTIRQWLARTPSRTFVLYPVLIIGSSCYAIEAIWYSCLGVVCCSPGVIYSIAFAGLIDGGTRRRSWYGRKTAVFGHRRPLPLHAKSDVSRSRYILARACNHLSIMVRACALRRHVFWFHYRIRKDEQRLKAFFGAPYLDYLRRVKRWIPHML